ncbi:MAG: diaminopimelate epimerase [Lachnospiraceae bacterium]|nr:diaminopimelate epimerase [Lachnospiraceae bacterium]
MKFTKMHGIGNDYVYVNCFEETVENPSELAIRVSDRHFGIGSDGLILIKPSGKADFRMEMYNADGSLGAMCGNGIRCVAKYVYDYGLTDKTRISVETASGIKYLDLTVKPSDAGSKAPCCGQDSRGAANPGLKKDASEAVSGAHGTPGRGKVSDVRVDMGAPILDPKLIPVDVDAVRKCSAICFGSRWPDTGVSPDADITPDTNSSPDTDHPQAASADQVGGFWNDLTREKPIIGETVSVACDAFSITCVSMGNPHCIVPVADVDGLEIEKIGPAFENHPMFPDRVNTEFVRVIDRNTVQMRVWERGSGETLACGTGACAVAVASVLNGWTENRLTVKLRGGDLQIEWDREKNTVYMTGPAETVFEGEICV